MNDRSELFTIGQLSRRTGLPVRTIRFWSDSDVLPPTGRSTTGYRLYDADAVARLDLVRTLRELGLDLETVRAVLARQVTVADVAAAHADALDAEIRILTVRRAVLRSIAQRGSTTEEMRLMHRLARLSAEERQRIVDDFVDSVFEGIDPGPPGAGIAQAMRQMPAHLPADPTPEQVDAWIELAELVGDPAFRQRARDMALAGASDDGSGDAPGQTAPGPQPDPAAVTPDPAAAQPDPAAVLEHAGAAVAAGIAPDSAEAAGILARIVDPATPTDERNRLADQLETFTDRRVERYWQLIGVLNGHPAFPPAVPAFEWLIAALRG